MTSTSVPHILVVEDDPSTARIVTTVFERVNPDIETDVVRDGSECLAVLRGEHDSIRNPDIILLDLNLLQVDGLTVLQDRLENNLMRQAPMIVVSGEDDSETVIECYDTGANTYFAKPNDLDGYLEMARSIVDYWLSRAELPGEHVATC